MLDAFAVASGIGRQASAGARVDRRRRFLAALRKSLDSEPFSESMRRSIARFYAAPDQPVDERQHWAFGARTIELCEEVCGKARVGAPSARPIKVKPSTVKLPAPPTVLVVGGTGFIGRRLVAALVAKGVGVRVLSRSRNSAAIAFGDLPIEIHEGFHGNPAVAKAALVGIATVYHLAKCEGKKWSDYVEGDIEPTRVLAEQALASGIKRFIYTGTINSYGFRELTPANFRRHGPRSAHRPTQFVRAIEGRLRGPSYRAGPYKGLAAGYSPAGHRHWCRH